MSSFFQYITKLSLPKLISLAAAFCLLLAIFTYHPDNKVVQQWAALDQGRVWNIYQYTSDHLYENGIQFFNYPPIHFLFDKLQYGISSLLVLGDKSYSAWLAAPNHLVYTSPHFAYYNVALKTPLILFTLATGLLIFHLARQHNFSISKSRFAVFLWFFNPITLYAIPIMGQNDIFAIFLFLLAWILLKKHPLPAAIIFGLAAATKSFPLVWLPFLLFTLKDLPALKRLLICLGSFLTYALTLLPFLSIPLFRSITLRNNIGTRFLIPSVGIWEGEVIMLAAILLMVLLALVISRRRPASDVLLVLNLIILGFSHFHPQWYSWIIPFWILWLFSTHKTQLPSRLFFSFSLFAAWALVILLFNDASLSFGLLLPANHDLYNFSPLIDTLAAHHLDLSDFNNYAHTWLAGLGVLGLISLALPKKQYEN